MANEKPKTVLPTEEYFSNVELVGESRPAFLRLKSLLIDTPLPGAVLSQEEVKHFISVNVDFISTLRRKLGFSQAEIIDVLEALSGVNLTRYDKIKGHTIAGRLAVATRAGYQYRVLPISREDVLEAMGIIEETRAPEFDVFSFIYSNKQKICNSYYRHKNLNMVSRELGLDIDPDILQAFIEDECYGRYEKALDILQFIGVEIPVIEEYFNEYRNCPVSIDDFIEDYGLSREQGQFLKQYIQHNGKIYDSLEEFFAERAKRIVKAEPEKFFMQLARGFNGYYCQGYYIFPTEEAAKEFLEERKAYCIPYTDTKYIPQKEYLEKELDNVATRGAGVWMFRSKLEKEYFDQKIFWSKGLIVVEEMPRFREHNIWIVGGYDRNIPSWIRKCPWIRIKKHYTTDDLTITDYSIYGIDAILIHARFLRHTLFYAGREIAEQHFIPHLFFKGYSTDLINQAELDPEQWDWLIAAYTYKDFL